MFTRPSSLRKSHSCATELLRAGVDVAVIALWLGHSSVETKIRIYLHADMSIKERALARTAPRNAKPGHYQADHCPSAATVPDQSMKAIGVPATSASSSSTISTNQSTKC